MGHIANTILGWATWADKFEQELWIWVVAKQKWKWLQHLLKTIVFISLEGKIATPNPE